RCEGTEMTNEEFDQAIEAIRQGHITPRERRVIAAATLMMRELCSVPDNIQPTHTQIIELIDSLDEPLCAKTGSVVKRESRAGIALYSNARHASDLAQCCSSRSRAR